MFSFAEGCWKLRQINACHAIEMTNEISANTRPEGIPPEHINLDLLFPTIRQPSSLESGKALMAICQCISPRNCWAVHSFHSCPGGIGGWVSKVGGWLLAGGPSLWAFCRPRSRQENQSGLKVTKSGQTQVKSSQKLRKKQERRKTEEEEFQRWPKSGRG